MRCFVALNLPETVLDSLCGVQQVVRAGRAVPRENMHLTLAFLEDQPEDVLEELHEDLSLIRVPPFEVVVSGLGSFGGDCPRMLYAGVEASPALIGLRRRVLSAARAAGIKLARERFQPHVTLARFRRDEGAQAATAVAWAMRTHGGLSLPAFQAKEFTLFQSKLTPGGAVHDPLAEYPLCFDGMIQWDGSVPQDF